MNFLFGLKECNLFQIQPGSVCFFKILLKNQGFTECLEGHEYCTTKLFPLNSSGKESIKIASRKAGQFWRSALRTEKTGRDVAAGSVTPGIRTVALKATDPSQLHSGRRSATRGQLLGFSRSFSFSRLP